MTVVIFGRPEILRSVRSTPRIAVHVHSHVEILLQGKVLTEPGMTDCQEVGRDVYRRTPVTHCFCHGCTGLRPPLRSQAAPIGWTVDVADCRDEQLPEKLART